MKFTVEHARKVAAELYDEPQARCIHYCEACDAIEGDWILKVDEVLAALMVLEDEQ